MNKICLIGLSYKTAPIEIREAFALSDVEKVYNSSLHVDDDILEYIILSTCNRVEILAVSENPNIKKILLSHWTETVGKPLEELSPYIYFHEGNNAVQHLFSVASSLDSMVIGEPQILGQLKEAYRMALEKNTAKVILSKLLHKSFSVAKRVRSETAIASSAVSISYAAIELAKRIFDDMKKVHAMLIGAGEMAELAATYLVQSGISSIAVCNRTKEKAEELAQTFNGKVFTFEELLTALCDVDIVISSTASPLPILHEKDMEYVMWKRKNKPMFFIDIAVPRDISPKINTIDNIYLYDIDDLKEIVQENLTNRKEEAQKASAIVREETVAFQAWIEALALQPTIIDFISRNEKIAGIELEKTFKQCTDLTPSQKQLLEVMVSSLVKKINHAPLSFLKHGMKKGSPTEQNLSLFRRIFDLDKENYSDS